MSLPFSCSQLPAINLLQTARRPLTSTQKLIPILCGIALIAGFQPGSLAESAATRITFTNSIKEAITPAAGTSSPLKNEPTVVRSQLTDAEAQSTIDFSIALKMRNFAQFQQRVEKGEIISMEEISAKYLPLSADIEKVRNWLTAEGFEVLPRTQYELSVFARGSVAQLQRALNVTFARVQFHGEEHTSAITAPSLPADIARPVLSINGLQPHLHPFPHSVRKAIGVGKSISNQPPYLVSEIAKAYDGLFADGTGQKIGIVIDTFPLASDLVAFWANDGVSQSLNNIEEVQVVAGALPAPSGEETLDVSWSSGIASDAKVRVYATTDLAFSHLDQAYQYIINDLPNQPTLHQLSMSFGLGEIYTDPGQMDTDHQFFSTLAGQGITIFVSAGDGGSNPGTDGQYSASNLPTVESPANDPSVTAVGGTSLFVNQNGTVSGETVWFDGTGGGQSQHFPRPSWQPGTGSFPGFGNGFAGRLVPDVALDADPNTGVFLVLDGQGWRFGGTSLSAPVWAGICARINQPRYNRGNTSLGLLGPDIYPLLGSSSFRDITSGTNGAYSAKSGFDLCTGIGVPDVNRLIVALYGAVQQPSGSGVAKDFNNDGSADVVLENTASGQRAIWKLNNGAYSSSMSLPTESPSWHIAATGDFLGTGQSDLVLENTSTGARVIWILNSGTIQYAISLPSIGGNWHVVGAGDFNGDGNADLVWENSSTGQRVIWVMIDGVFVSEINLGQVSLNWHIAGVGDFLGNGQSDLVWENTSSGQRVIWLMSNGSFNSETILPTIATQWHIAGAADFTGNGQSDLALENSSTGQRIIWVLDNGLYSSTTSLPTVSPAWHIVDH
jgi:kumamolisin